MPQIHDRSQWFYRLFLIGLLIFSLAILGISALKGNSPDLIVSDGNGYYAWVRSLVIDGDIDFKDDFEQLYFPDPPPPEWSQRTPKGLVPNKYPIGLAILETPGFLIGHAIAKLTTFADDGISLPYQLSVTISLVMLILASFYLLYQALRNYQISSQIALLFCVMPLIGTNLIHYVAKEPAMAHGAGVAMINILIFISSLKANSFKSKFLAGLIPGLLMGLTIIIRLSNIVFLPCYFWLFRSDFSDRRKSLPLVLGIGSMVFLQQFSLFCLWGKPVANSYQGQGFTAGIQGVFDIVLGTHYGLFLYHPWYLVLVSLNIVGICLLARQQKLWHGIILFCFTGLWILNGLWGFSGDSFGSRAFIESLPLLSLGAAMTVEHLSDRTIHWMKFPGLILAGLLIATNIYLWGGYLLQQYPQNSERTLEQAYLWLATSSTKP
ncbi:MAG TPA: hypothetical protein V6C64_07045 [Microcoleaceae cyanobacterium]